MLLVGRFTSPYVRRVGVCMTELGLAYERESVSPLQAPERVEAFNPMGRVPVLVLDDGEKLVESSAIIDYLTERTGDDRLWPRAGRERRDINQLVALISTALEKAVYALYETIKRPPEKYHEPFVTTLHRQLSNGLGMLEERLAGDWFVGRRLTLADIAVAIGWRSLQSFAPSAATPDRFPRLGAHARRCEALSSFTACQPESG
jgi:glutathione S-transferase